MLDSNTDDASIQTARLAKELQEVLSLAYAWPPVPTRLHGFVLSSHRFETRMTGPQDERTRVFYAQCVRSGEIHAEPHPALQPPPIGDLVERARAAIAHRCNWPTLDFKDSFARDSSARRLFGANLERPDESLRRAVRKKSKAETGARMERQMQPKGYAER